jgi:hypothetical protein
MDFPKPDPSHLSIRSACFDGRFSTGATSRMVEVEVVDGSSMVDEDEEDRLRFRRGSVARGLLEDEDVRVGPDGLKRIDKKRLVSKSWIRSSLVIFNKPDGDEKCPD